MNKVEQIPCIEGKEHEEGDEIQMQSQNSAGFEDRYKCANCGKTLAKVYYVEYVGMRIEEGENYSEDF